MQVFLDVNGLSITGSIAENGIAQSGFTRKAIEVVTLDGYAERGNVKKRRINVRLVEVTDKRWYAICAALKTDPATVHYIDDAEGEVTKRFYVTSPTAQAKRVVGGITYFSGGTFTLEEV